MIDQGMVRELSAWYPEVRTGTWTPAWTGSGTPGTFTYTTQLGRWMQLGQLVFIQARLNISAISVAPTGNMSITGMPFAVDSGGLSVPVTVGFTSNLLFTANTIQLVGLFVNAATSILLYQVFSNAAATQYPAANFTNVDSHIYISGVYRTA